MFIESQNNKQKNSILMQHLFLPFVFNPEETKIE